MLKLPVCPYCHARYNYKDVKNMYKRKKENCHNCKKSFNISYKGNILLIIIGSIIIATMKVISFNIFANINIWLELIFTIIPVTILFCLFPCTVKFYKDDSKNKK